MYKTFLESVRKKPSSSISDKNISYDKQFLKVHCQVGRIAATAVTLVSAERAAAYLLCDMVYTLVQRHLPFHRSLFLTDCVTAIAPECTYSRELARKPLDHVTTKYQTAYNIPIYSLPSDFRLSIRICCGCLVPIGEICDFWSTNQVHSPFG